VLLGAGGAVPADCRINHLASSDPRSDSHHTKVYIFPVFSSTTQGDLVSLGSGGAVPADCRINHGQIEVDQAALTGESLAVTMYFVRQPDLDNDVDV
jgi:high-affinity K+ transport system ATPase subunit B